jgi:hypothetical protein
VQASKPADLGAAIAAKSRNSMEACYAKGGEGSRNSIPQIPVGKLAYQNCSRNNGTVACGNFTPLEKH